MDIVQHIGMVGLAFLIVSVILAPVWWLQRWLGRRDDERMRKRYRP